MSRPGKSLATGPGNRPAELRRTVLSLCGLCLCLAALTAAFSGLFRVRHVDVVGSNLPVDRIIRASRVYDQNIFRIRSDQVVARLTGVPEVIVDRVETAFPDRVTIRARLRRAMVAWQSRGGLYLVDPQGNLIDRVRSTTLPVITGVSGGGDQPSLGPGIVQAVRYAVQLLPASTGGGIAAFSFDHQSGLSIVGRPGWQAQIGAGDAQTLVQRIATLAAFLRSIGPRVQKLKSVDLRSSTPYAVYTGA
ncbi:MAG: cell division protein FtsQ/DivIB [Chloroflexota bacterium]|nr:cell division protein FtsQ/DivIB [Chloroflexota bacterium]